MLESLYIIIVTFNGMPWLKKCLDSCSEYSVVVVDNASTDETVSFIEANYSNVTLKKQSKNLGFGQANNQGIRYALDQGAEQVFLLNQDAYLREGCLENLVTVQKMHLKYGILSPIHLNGKGNRLDKLFSNYISYRNNPDFYSDFILTNPLKEIYEVPFINAAGWLMTRELLENVGGFDPLFFHYGEDDNYCQRAHYHNFKIGVVPVAFIHHDREQRKVKVNRDDLILKLERRLKKRYADINIANTAELKNSLKKKRRVLIKLFLSFKFSKMEFVRQEIGVIKKVMLEIEQSRKTNMNRGMHYLEIIK